MPPFLRDSKGSADNARRQPGEHHHFNHPMDWVAYLRQAVVLDPVPTILTLLILAAHLYACHTQQSVGATAVPPQHNGGNHSASSVLGFVFESMGRLMHHASPGTHVTSSIRTPFSPRSSSTPKNKDNSTVTAGTDMQQQPSSLADQMLSTAMMDPMTMMHDAWMYLWSNEGAGPQQQHDDSSSKNEQQCSSESDATRPTAPHPASSSSAVLAVWMDVCMLHLLGMGAAGLMLLPSILNQSMLACNVIIPGIQASCISPCVHPFARN